MGKIQIAIELQDYNYENLDLSKPSEGNPGVGGSEFLFLLLAETLVKFYPSKYDVTIFHYKKVILPEGIKDVIVCDENDLIKKVEKLENPILVHQIYKRDNWYKHISKTNIKDIPWAHCYIQYNEVININSCENVKRVVFVGKEEYDSYIDDDIIKKSVCIYNMLNTENINHIRKDTYPPYVTYMGSLVPEKGFHKLAEIWPEILERVPEAELYVIGSGKLYNRNAEIGKYGISQSDYEQLFMKYLTNSDDKILPSVHFLGLLGEGKEEYFINTSVGVVNPTAKDETFCLSAVEMELCGVPIVAKRKYGLLDTILHKKTGLLFKNKKQFINHIVRLLNDNSYNNELGNNAREFIKNSFDVSMIIRKWDDMFSNVNIGSQCVYVKPNKNYNNDLKWLRILNHGLRFKLNFKFLPSINKLKYIIKGILKR